MMMPANFSVIAENEMTYLGGGEASLATLGSNIVTIIGNSFVSNLVDATLGELFGGNYAVGGVFSALGNLVTGNNTYDLLNSVLQVVGLGAATYQLSTKNVGVLTPKSTFIFSVESAD